MRTVRVRTVIENVPADLAGAFARTIGAGATNESGVVVVTTTLPAGEQAIRALDQLDQLVARAAADLGVHAARCDHHLEPRVPA